MHMFMNKRVELTQRAIALQRCMYVLVHATDRDVCVYSLQCRPVDTCIPTDTVAYE